MSIRIITGDALDQLRLLPDESVHCCVTSPPYYGLRDYGTAQWDGGDPACNHRQGRPGAGRADGIVDERSQRNRDGVGSMGGDCKCGARRIDSQIGLEPSPDEYVAALVAVFREVRRVLRGDGTVFLNLGDSYAGGSPVGWRAGNPEKNKGNSNRDGVGAVSGCKPKDLIGIPWLVAFAQRADGWWLRQDIIWSKPNPMPESVTDRCTKAHEYIFMLSKSARYYFDAAAIKEPSVDPVGSANRYMSEFSGRPEGAVVCPGDDKGQRYAPKGMREFDGTRNKRSVWDIATSPYAAAHFATFPPALIEPCILAGCPKGGTVLDCFGGAGTTGLVADRLGRNAILIELSETYAEMARRRIHADAPLFADVMRDKPGCNQAVRSQREALRADEPPR